MEGMEPGVVESSEAPVTDIGNTEEFGAEGAQQTQERKPVNLDEFDEFKAWKTKVNQTISERDKQLREEKRRADAEIRARDERIRAMEEDYERRVISTLSETEQMEYRLNQEMQRRQQMEQQLGSIEQERSKYEFINSLKDRYGILPTDDSHPMTAVGSIADTLYEQVKRLSEENAKLKRETDARKAALEDAPDLGSGTPSHPVSDIQKSYDRAMMSADGRRADELSRLAAEKGLTLDRFSWVKQQQRG